MKKKEAIAIAPKNSNILLNQIDKILGIDEPVEAFIYITFDKLDKKNMVVYDINIPKKSIHYVLLTGITLQQGSVLDNQILNDIVNCYLESDFVKISNFIWMRGTRHDFEGISIKSGNGTMIYLDFGRIDKEISASYSERIKEYENSLQKGASSKL